MASVTVNLSHYNLFNGIAQWLRDVSLGPTFSFDGTSIELKGVQLRSTGARAGQVTLDLNTGERFTAAFESTGRLIFEASDGELLEVMIANADMQEPYNWTPANSAEVIAFAIHVESLTDHDATLLLSDAGPPDRPDAPTVTGTDSAITAVGVAPPDADPTITSYDWRIKRTSSSIWGNRLDQTSLTQTWTSLQAATEYEVQFRATNSEGDSAYSESGLFTTDVQTTLPASFTTIPTPVSGDEWDEEDWVRWVVDNINSIHALQTGNVPGTTFAPNDVVIGADAGALVGVDLANGSLLVGGATIPVALAIGTNGQRLRVVNGVVTWVTP